MAGLTDSAGLLFQIRADNVDALKKVEETKAAIKILKDTSQLGTLEKELQSLMAGGVTSAGSLQKGFHEAASELSNLTAIFTGNRLSGATSQITSFSGAVSAIPGPAGAAVGAIAGIAVAAVAAGTALFEMTVKAAETGEVFKRFQAITGFSAEATSTLNYYAKLTGKSLEEMAIPMSKFGKLVQESINDPTSKAAKTLQNAGVTSTDLTIALDQATKHMESLGEGTARTTEGIELFGGRGVKVVIPLLDKMHGGFLNAIAAAKELGLTLSQEDIEAAEAFGKTLKTVEAQLGIAVDRFALAYGPAITGMLQSISQFLADNKDTWAEWGQYVGTAIRGVINTVKALEDMGASLVSAFNSFFRTNLSGWQIWAEGIRIWVAYATANLSEFAIAAAQYMAGPTAAASGTIGPGVIKQPRTGGPKVPKAGKGAGAKDNTEKNDLEASLQLQDLYLKRVEAAYKETSDRLEKEFAKTGDQAAFSLGAKQAIDVLHESSAKIFAEMERLEAKRAALEKETAHQKELRDEKVVDKHKELDKKIADETDKVNKKITDADKKLADDRAKIAETTAKLFEKYRKEEEADAERSMSTLIETNQRYTDSVIADNQTILDDEHSTVAQRKDAQQSLLDAIVANAGFLTTIYEQDRDRKITAINEEEKFQKAEIERTIRNEEEKQKLLLAIQNLYQQRRELSEAEFQKRLAEIGKGAVVPVKGAPAYDFGLSTSLDTFIDKVKAAGPTLKEAFSQIADIGVNAFQSLGQAVGSLVQNWVLMGETGPAAMRKMVATVLAGVAAQATVLAIFELAKGFAALFWDPAEAGAHFTAAALFGSIAAVTAVAGRAVAGNAFKQQSSTATGGAGSSASGTNPLTDANNPQNRFTEVFNGFSKQISKIQDRANAVLGGVEEQLNRFNETFGLATPTDVVMAGAGGAGAAIFDAHTSALGTGSRAETFRRTLG